MNSFTPESFCTHIMRIYAKIGLEILHILIKFVIPQKTLKFTNGILTLIIVQIALLKARESF